MTSPPPTGPGHGRPDWPPPAQPAGRLEGLLAQHLEPDGTLVPAGPSTRRVDWFHNPDADVA